MPHYFIESYSEFADRMACPHVFLETDKRPFFRDGRFGDELILFENGGYSDGDKQHTDPPTDPAQLVVQQHLFWSEKLKHKGNEYNSFIETVDTQNSWHQRRAGPSVDMRYPNWVEHIEKLAKERKELGQKVQELEAQLPKDPREEARAERQRRLDQTCQSTFTRLKDVHKRTSQP